MTRSFSRFYKTASHARVAEGHVVELDGRPVRTPGTRAPLVLPTAALAKAVAEEWRRQGDTVDPVAMPLTALGCTAIDLVPRRAEVASAVAAYASCDLLCYRVPEPAELAQRQHDLWQPWLDWAALHYDARLNVTTGIQPVTQPPEACQALGGAVAALDDARLAALSAATQTTGSLVLGLALVERALDAGRAFALAELEASHELEAWGMDAEAEKRRTALVEELTAAARFVQLLAHET